MINYFSDYHVEQEGGTRNYSEVDHPIFYLSLLSSDPLCQSAPIYNIKTRMVMQRHGISFLNGIDLQQYHEEKTQKGGMLGKSSQPLDVYTLAKNFINDHRQGCFFVAHVPLIKGGK